MKNELYFLRLFRTPNSEVWLIDFKDERIGTVHLHLKQYAIGDVILTKKLNPEELENVLESLDEWIVNTIEEREDFAFSVYDAVEIGTYSDTVDHDYYPPTRKDIKEHGVLLNKVLSKYQDTRGQLNEHVVKDYFNKIGFTSIKADSKLDAMKVDIVAESDSRILYCQVKLGSINSREINKICANISKIKPINQKKKIAVIVAESFPSNVEIIKEVIEQEHELRVWTISKSQILKVLPEYKRTS